MKQDDRQSIWLSAFCGVFAVIWLALLLAPYLRTGLPGMMEGFSKAINQPFRIKICKDSVRTIFLFLSAYGLSIGIYLSTRRNYRKGVEHGSAL